MVLRKETTQSKVGFAQGVFDRLREPQIKLVLGP